MASTFTEQLSEGLCIAGYIEPQTLISSGTASDNTGNGLDMKYFQRAMFVFQTGSVTAGGSLVAKLQSSATSGGSFTDIANTSTTAITTSNKQASIEINASQMPAGQPFLRAVMTVTGGFNVVCSGVLLGGVANYSPASDQDPASVVQRLVYNSDDA